jgi:protein TonB
MGFGFKRLSALSTSMNSLLGIERPAIFTACHAGHRLRCPIRPNLERSRTGAPIAAGLCMRPSAATTSAAVHGAAVLSLLFLFHVDRLPPGPVPGRNLYIPLLRTPPRWRRDAGGGQRESLPASKGPLPPHATRRVFVPPTANILNDHPRLPIEQAILEQPAPDVSLNAVGDPFGLAGPLSGGRGGPGGIGDGGCCGVGNGKGPGLGGATAPPPMPKPRKISLPVLIYKVEPEYSEEARKAKYQGVVVLVAEVDGDGKTRNMRVIRALGLGLDEKAIAAASLWRFRPATADGQPVPYPVTIEVNFRLL